MIFRRSLILIAIIIVLAAAGAGLAQISAKSGGTPAVEKSALVTRSFNLSGQSRETVDIEVSSPGKLEVKAQWTGSAAKLALILNGPDRTQFYARQDGQSPLTLSFQFNQSHLAKGKDWKVSVALFGEGTARGKIEIHLPRAAEPAAPGQAAAPGLSKAAPKAQREISVAQPGIEVKAPTSDTRIVAGGNCRVQWASTGSIDKVSIWMEYIDRNGQVTVNQIPGIGNTQVANTGSRTIRIPESWSSEHGERWRIKIAGGGAEGRSEMLTITRAAAQQDPKTGAAPQQQTQTSAGGAAAAAGPAGLTLLSPNGGEELISGHTYKVLWQSTGDPGPLTLYLLPPTTGMGSAPQGAQQKPQGIVVARDFPNTGELDWTATRTGGPPSKWKLALAGPNARDESDGWITLAPYIELFIGEISVRNPEKKQNWALRTLKAIATVGLSEVKESIDLVKDDKDEGPRLRRGTDIVVGFAVMQLGTRTINERVHTRITILELPSRAPVEVMACESRLSGRDPHYICQQTFKTSGPLFKAGKYLIEIAVDPNKAIPEEPAFRDNNVKTIEFQLVEGDPSSSALDMIR